MEFILALLLWLSGGAGLNHSQDLHSDTESVQHTHGARTFKRASRPDGRRTIIVLDDTQFRPVKQ